MPHFFFQHRWQVCIVYLCNTTFFAKKWGFLGEKTRFWNGNRREKFRKIRVFGRSPGGKVVWRSTFCGGPPGEKRVFRYLTKTFLLPAESYRKSVCYARCAQWGCCLIHALLSIWVISFTKCKQSIYIYVVYVCLIVLIMNVAHYVRQVQQYGQY